MNCNLERTVDKKNIFAGFAPVSLEEIRGAALMRRRDVKYLMREEQLAEFLPHLFSRYRILDNCGMRRFRYATHYFDTADYSCYHEHHNGHLERCKVRVREYCDSHTVFAEVKKRYNTGETVKTRIKRKSLVGPDDSGFAELIRKETALDPQMLVPSVSIHCKRSTLVDIACCERVTIDREVCVSLHNREKKFPGLVILEIKRAALHELSETAVVLARHGIAAVGYSKYCMGVAALCDTVKKNRFKPKQMHVARLLSSPLYAEVVS